MVLLESLAHLLQLLFPLVVDVEMVLLESLEQQYQPLFLLGFRYVLLELLAHSIFKLSEMLAYHFLLAQILFPLSSELIFVV